MELKISCKSAAKRRSSVQSVSYQYDAPIRTVRDLLTQTVKINVAEYQKRQESSELLHILTKEEIEDKSTQGKIGFGRIYGERKPQLDKAVQTALGCFEDGIAVVFADGKQLLTLDEPLTLHDGSEITFVRMTLLAGRMW